MQPLSVYTSSRVEKRLRNISSAARYTHVFFLSHARDCTMFTLHDLNDFLRREGESAPH